GRALRLSDDAERLPHCCWARVEPGTAARIERNRSESKVRRSGTAEAAIGEVWRRAATAVRRNPHIRLWQSGSVAVRCPVERDPVRQRSRHEQVEPGGSRVRSVEGGDVEGAVHVLDAPETRSHRVDHEYGSGPPSER